MRQNDEQNNISWDSMELVPDKDPVVNKSTHTKIIYATWKRNQLNQPVALKMISNAVIAASNEETYKQGLRFIDAEAEILKKISKYNLENIVEFHGVVEGNLYNEGNKCQAKAIILKAYPVSLEWYLEFIEFKNSKNSVSELYSLNTKIFILMEIMKALNGLHSFGIIHGDIKPPNILLSDQCPPSVRVCDFGLSRIKESIVGRSPDSASTVQLTQTFQGTKAYAAPEMIKSSVKSSRSTDIFAFGVLGWEILSGLRFNPRENDKSSHIPDFTRCDRNCVPGLVDLLKKCCSLNREERPSANFCCLMLSSIMTHYENQNYDIFFSHAWLDKGFLQHFPPLFMKLGYRVWYDVENMGHELRESMKKGVLQSRIFIACLSEAFIQSVNCEYEMKTAIKNKKIVIALLLENKTMISKRMSDYMQKYKISEKYYLDFSELAKNSAYKWEYNPLVEQSVSYEEEAQKNSMLWGDVKRIFRFLRDYGVYPKILASDYLNSYADNITPVLQNLFPLGTFSCGASNEELNQPRGSYALVKQDNHDDNLRFHDQNHSGGNYASGNVQEDELLKKIMRNSSDIEEFICSLDIHLQCIFSAELEVFDSLERATQMIDFNFLPKIIELLNTTRVTNADSFWIKERILEILIRLQKYQKNPKDDTNLEILFDGLESLRKRRNELDSQENLISNISYQSTKLSTEIIYCLIILAILIPLYLLLIICFYLVPNWYTNSFTIYLYFLAFYPIISLVYCLFWLTRLRRNQFVTREPILWFQYWIFPSLSSLLGKLRRHTLKPTDGDDSVRSLISTWIFRLATGFFYLLWMGSLVFLFILLPMRLRFDWEITSCVLWNPSQLSYSYWGSKEYESASIECVEDDRLATDDHSSQETYCSCFYTKSAVDDCEFVKQQLSSHCERYFTVLPNLELAMIIYSLVLMVMIGYCLYYRHSLQKRIEKHVYDYPVFLVKGGVIQL